MEPADAISEHLEPRLLALGFAVLAGGRKSNGYWAFRRGNLKIALALDTRNGELGISLCDLPSERLIEFWLFGELVGDPTAARMGSIVLARSGAREVLYELCETIERNIDVLANWDAALAQRFFSRQSEIRDAEWRAARLADALKLADGSWRSGNYAEFVRLLAPFEDELSPATLENVRYAERRSKSDARRLVLRLLIDPCVVRKAGALEIVCDHASG